MNLSVWHDVEEELPSYDNSLGKDGLPNTSTGLSYRSPSVLICTKEGVRVGYLQWRYDSPTTPYRWFLDGREEHLACLLYTSSWKRSSPVSASSGKRTLRRKLRRTSPTTRNTTPSVC